MKRFTKSILALALLLVGATSVNAQNEVHATFENPTGITWDAENKTFSWSSQYGNQLHNIGLPSGNITQYEKVVVDCDIIEGTSYRIMFYATTKGTTAGGITVIESNGKHEFKLSDFSMDADYLTQCSEFCLSGNGVSGKVKVNDVYFVMASDPLAGSRKLLMDAITLGKNQNPFAKTDASWSTLLTAISDGQTEYVNDAATAESLENATMAIGNAVNGLKLEPGYAHLTTDMYHEWDGIGDDAQIVGNGARNLALYTSMPNGGELLYGDPNVNYKHYAKLVNAKSIVILGTTPGLGFGARTNRLEDQSLQQLDVQLDEDGKGIIDISAAASIRINAIKHAYDGKNGVVTDLLVEFKPVEATIGAAGYATFATDRPVKFEGVKAYVAKLNGKSLTLTAVTEVPANTAVILEGAADTYSFPVIEAAAAVDNDLKVSDGNVGTAGNIYVLANGKNGVGFYQLEVGKSVPAGKAYVELPVDAPALEFIGFDGVVTGIDTVGVDGTDTYKEGLFNLAGQRVNKTTKGLYIVNGKKVVIK